MNRRFFLCGAIAAPAVAGSPLARFIVPAPYRLDVLYGYKLGDTIQIRMPREFSVRGLLRPVDEVRDYVVTDMAT